MIQRALPLLLVLLVACAPDPLGRRTSEVQAQKQQCDADGGKWLVGGLTRAMMCFREMLDAGKACRGPQDCQSLCLSDANPAAKTGTCAPVAPLFGCVGILLEEGERVEMCID